MPRTLQIESLNSSSNLTFSTGANIERLRIDSSGNVGIGTTSVTSGYKLDTRGWIRAQHPTGDCVVAAVAGNTTGVSALYFGDSADNNVGSIEYNHTSNSVYFRTNTTERLRITSTGGISFGSGGTNYGTSGQFLTSQGNASPIWTTVSYSTLTLNTSGIGLSGSTTYTPAGAATFTVTCNATTTATASAIVARDAAGHDYRVYGFGTYFNSTDNVSGDNISYIMAKFGDNYHRSATAARVAAFISGQSMNISGSSTSCSGNSATATGQQSGANFTLNTGGPQYGLVGIYNPDVHQSIFAMGPSYLLASGTALGSFYGVSWSYDHSGRQLNTGYNLGHCLAIANAGVVATVIGVGIWTSGQIRTNGALSCGGGLGVGTLASGTAGEIRATNNITAYYSDERLKNFIGKISNALEKVNSLNGYYYKENFKAKELGYNNDSVQVGISAQEVEKILPEIVTLAPIDCSTDSTGKTTSKTGQNYKTVYYEKLIPLLIEAVKELSSEINKLKEEIDELKENK